MEEYSIFDYSILRDLIINAGKNPIGVKEFIKCLITTYNKILFVIIIVSIIISIILFGYKHIIKNGFEFTKISTKNTFNELRQKYKNNLRKLCYPLIGYILIVSSRLFISLIFYDITNRIPQVNYQLTPREQPRFLGTLSLQARLFFTIGAFFIGLSFGNKFVRNIGIFVYIIGISIIFLGLLGHFGFYIPE